MDNHYSPSLYISRYELFLFSLRNPLLLYLLSFLDVDTICTLAKVSRRLRAFCGYFSADAWNIDKFLRPWFSNLHGFRQVLHSCGAIISGSQALQFFNRVRYPTSDMDIYVRMTGLLQLTRWLLGQGYRRDTSNGIAGLAYLTSAEGTVLGDRDFFQTQRKKNKRQGNITGIYNYVNLLEEVSHPGERRYVQVIVLAVDPIEHILFDYHSTVVMNFISATRAVCVFPKSTIVENVNYGTRKVYGDGRRSERWIQKYRERGFRNVVTALQSDLKLKHSELHKRYVGDTFCWIRNFHGKVTPLTVYSTLNLDCPFDISTTGDASQEAGAITLTHPLTRRKVRCI